MERHCPRCESPLAARQSHGVEVDVCRACGGVFFDAGEFDDLVAERLEQRRLESTFAFIAGEASDPLPCPAGCAVAMSVVNHDHIEIDYCTTCGGVWVDGDERAAFGRRPPTDNPTDEMVRCDGCGDAVPRRVCILRMDGWYCEACVVAGNHPGKEAQLVGMNDLRAAAARSYAARKSDQADARDDLAEHRRRNERRKNWSWQRMTDIPFIEALFQRIHRLTRDL